MLKPVESEVSLPLESERHSRIMDIHDLDLNQKRGGGSNLINYTMGDFKERILGAMEETN